MATMVGEWRPGDSILDTYDVRSLLGEGGMGRVYRVHHRQWDVDLAMKAPLPVVLAGGVEPFIREAETWVRLELHPNVVTCYYVRPVDGVPCVFIDYVEGGSLAGWIADGRLYAGGERVALARVLDVAIQFAWGLDHAHAHGLIHQDVKPGNALFCERRDPQGDGFRPRAFGARRSPRAGYRAPASPPRPPSRTWDGRRCTRPPSRRGANGSRGPRTCGRGRCPCSRCSPAASPGGSDRRRLSCWRTTAIRAQARTGCRACRTSWPTCSPAASPTIPSARPQSLGELAAAVASIHGEATGAPYGRPRPERVVSKADSLNNRALSLLDLGHDAEADERLGGRARRGSAPRRGDLQLGRPSLAPR